MENYQTIKLTNEEMENTGGGWVLEVLGGVGIIFGAGYAIGYTAHFVYDKLKED